MNRLANERRVHGGMTPLPVRRGRPRAMLSARRDDQELTPRQLTVLEALMRGLTNKEIAAELEVGVDAIKRMISRLLSKLDAPNRAALVQAALRTAAARAELRGVPSAFALLAAAPIGAAITRGPEHRIVYANEVFRATFAVGHAHAGSLGSLLDAITTGEATAAADEVLATGGQRVIRGAVVDPRRDPPQLDVRVSPLRDGEGRIAGLVVFVTEIAAA